MKCNQNVWALFCAQESSCMNRVQCFLQCEYLRKNYTYYFAVHYIDREREREKKKKQTLCTHTRSIAKQIHWEYAVDLMRCRKKHFRYVLWTNVSIQYKIKQKISLFEINLCYHQLTSCILFSLPLSIRFIISSKNLHLVRAIMGKIFAFISEHLFRKEIRKQNDNETCWY